MTNSEKKDFLFKIANDCIKDGPGHAQESVALNRAIEQLMTVKQPDGEVSLEEQQILLDCWHDLFKEGKLVWGYDVDMPNSPFFHRRANEGEKAMGDGRAAVRIVVILDGKSPYTFYKYADEPLDMMEEVGMKRHRFYHTYDVKIIPIGVAKIVDGAIYCGE